MEMDLFVGLKDIK